MDKLTSFFDKKGFLIISKYDKNQQPVQFEKIEEIAIESEAEEIKIECEEDKIVEALKEKEEEANDKGKKSKAKEEEIEEESDEFDPAKHWKLVTDENGLLNAKGIIEKNYPDVIIISHSLEYVPKEPVTLSDKDLEEFSRFCADLSEVEEFEKVYTNVN